MNDDATDDEVCPVMNLNTVYSEDDLTSCIEPASSSCSGIEEKEEDGILEEEVACSTIHPAKIANLFRGYNLVEDTEDSFLTAANQGYNLVEDTEDSFLTAENQELGSEICLKFANGKLDTEMNSVAVATKIGQIIQNLGIAESNSDIPPWAKSLIMALGEATTELQYISTDQTERTKDLQTTITDQSIKINQLEERCHIQEFLMKILQEEKDLLTERIHNFEIQMKKHKKETKSYMEQIVNFEGKHEESKQTYLERIEQLQATSEEGKIEKVFLLDKIDTFEVTLKNNKDEKEKLLETIDQLESTLDDAMVYIKKNCLLNRELQEGGGGEETNSKSIDRNSDKEAVRNFIHNMLHKDKLSKLI